MGKRCKSVDGTRLCISGLGAWVYLCGMHVACLLQVCCRSEAIPGREKRVALRITSAQHACRSITEAAHACVERATPVQS